MRSDIADDRDRIKDACKRVRPSDLQEPYANFAAQVAAETSRRWLRNLKSIRDKEVMLWRILRLYSSPYFLLGSSAQGNSPLQLRIATPWDWRQQFSLLDFEVFPRSSGQPEIEWNAIVYDRGQEEERHVAGHIEMRWSHGRFCGVPEAKVYLDTPYIEVPEYHTLS